MAIDLEHFPTSTTALRMMERISPIYGRSYVGKWIFQVMGLEMDEARALFEALRDEAFPERTTWTIDYWERRYAITPKPTETLEERRRNIKMKQSIALPMNPARMEEIVSGMTGGSTTVTENIDDYTFAVDVQEPGPRADLAEVLKHIKELKPSHQTFELRTTARPQEQTVWLAAIADSLCITTLPELEPVFPGNLLHVTPVMGNGISYTTLPPLEPVFRPALATIYAAGAIQSITETALPTMEEPDTTIMPPLIERMTAAVHSVVETILPPVPDPTPQGPQQVMERFTAAPAIAVMETSLPLMPDYETTMGAVGRGRATAAVQTITETILPKLEGTV